MQSSSLANPLCPIPELSILFTPFVFRFLDEGILPPNTCLSSPRRMVLFHVSKTSMVENGFKQMSTFTIFAEISLEMSRKILPATQYYLCHWNK